MDDIRPLGPTASTTATPQGGASQMLTAPGTVTYATPPLARSASSVKSGVTSSGYRYTGQLDMQGSIGLDYYVARFYDPQLARFAQADSIIPEPGNNQSFDRYAYVKNNPILYADPTGHKWVCTGVNNDHCYDDGTGPVSGMVVNPYLFPNSFSTQKRKQMQLEQKFSEFIPLKTVGQDEMVEVFTAEITPEEKRLISDDQGNLDYKKLFQMKNIYDDAINTTIKYFTEMVGMINPMHLGMLIGMYY